MTRSAGTSKVLLICATVAAMERGALSHPSSIEDEVAVTLDRLGISYERQKQIAFWCVDFILASGQIVEVNGTFWHADPRQYSGDNLKAAQHKNVIRDQRKRTFFANRGIPFIEIWEADIKKDITAAVAAALELQYGT